jgi:CPA2 family monovalent cation:H+ antiporter-2
METTAPAILEIGIVLLAAVGAGFIARRIGLPAVVGYLLVGLAVSPFTPGYVADPEQLHLLADVGVVLLLFEVGIEVDLRTLRREQRALFWVAPAQMLLTTLIGGALFVVLGFPPIPAAILGLCVAFSSSVVVVNITRSRRRTTDLPTERSMLGWAVLQDVTGVLAAGVLLAAFAIGGRPVTDSLLGLVAFAILALVTARLLPLVLAGLRHEHDLFLITSVASGLALAGIGAVIFGVPLALAAFVGGLAITESPTAAEARRRLLPFRDLFAVLFFVAIGTLVDPGDLLVGLPMLGAFLVLIVVAKSAIAYGLARVARLPARPLQLAVGLGQMGEFGFVLGSALVAAGAITGSDYVALLAAVVVSIAASAILVRAVVPGGRPHGTSAGDAPTTTVRFQPDA